MWALLPRASPQAPGVNISVETALLSSSRPHLGRCKGWRLGPVPGSGQTLGTGGRQGDHAVCGLGQGPLRTDRPDSPCLSSCHGRDLSSVTLRFLFVG